VGRGRSKCPSYHSLVLHPPTPYTLSPLLKGGEGRGEGGSYTRMPCPFGALLVTLYQIFSKGFLNGKRNIRGGGQRPKGAGRRPKRKFIIGNGISRGGAEEPLTSSYEIKPAIAGVTKPSPVLVLIQSTVSQTTPPSFSMMPVPSTWRSPGGAPMTATVS
jgi:hypothetical protein